MYRNPLSSGGYSMSFRFIAQNCSNLSVKIKLDFVILVTYILLQLNEVNETWLEQHANFSYRSLTCMNLFLSHHSSLFSLKPTVSHLHYSMKTVMWQLTKLKEKAIWIHIVSPTGREILGHKLWISITSINTPVPPLPAPTAHAVTQLVKNI